MIKIKQLETREETIKNYRDWLVKEFSNRAFNMEEALMEFDSNPENFNMVFVSLADVVCDTLKTHPKINNISQEKLNPGNHNCNYWGWFLRPDGRYPKIIIE